MQSPWLPEYRCVKLAVFISILVHWKKCILILITEHTRFKLLAVILTLYCIWQYTRNTVCCRSEWCALWFDERLDSVWPGSQSRDWSAAACCLCLDRQWCVQRPWKHCGRHDHSRGDVCKCHGHDELPGMVGIEYGTTRITLWFLWLIVFLLLSL